jgi:nitroimidazol reductase NimA-like FMN-containing flavoprotein (pyridoxamine 5'-phosphate oxidase superfamily)
METEMMRRMKSLVREHNTCVLATVSDGRPHCSLMAYATDDACGVLYMATSRATTKYRNLTSNPHVSLLIDTRADHPGKGPPDARALTISGEFHPIRDRENRASVEARLANVHPYLKDFMKNKDAEVFSVKVTSLLLLEGLSDAYYEEV